MSSSANADLGLVQVLRSAMVQGVTAVLHKLASRPSSSDLKHVHKN